MAVIQKTLFAKNLDRYSVLVNDIDPNSRYFKITELPDTFTGGKNAFLIAGSEELLGDTKIQIELKDGAGNIIYHEPGEGMISSSFNGETFVTEYFEGVSKVVSVYIYPDTSYGPCTLTILGELSKYEDGNGIINTIPIEWEGQYNVKWQKTINVNPSLVNTTKIRFYQRPTATITELLNPLYRIENDLKVASAVTQSFANIKLSKLETFAGDVKRIKVFRTSEGDISDYDLIQDILVESKELLTSYGLSGSVVGQTGILTSETLKNNWNTGSLNAFLTSSRVESGVKLTGSGYFTYTQSLDLKSTNTYELNLDAFYSASTPSNLGIYLVSGSMSSSVGTLYGISPTKNLLDTVIPFKISTDFPSASLYFSQSQGEWHLGNISLKLSEDTAFSPDEVSFVTTMPTVLGNEIYNFKFEFYDVNNNYVPVAVTQSAVFTGGNNNINGTLTLISSSASGSLADLNRVSSSISGTVTLNSSSVSGSINTLSGSVSGSINTLSSSVSGSITTLSGSVSSSINSLSSSVSSSNAIILSSSFAQVKNLADGRYSGSFIGDTVIYSPAIGGQQGYIKDLFTVGDTTAAQINLDARTIPRKIYIGTGTYNSANTAIYLDSSGQFSLKDKLTFDTSGNLSVNGTINITGGNAATQTYATGIGTSAVATAAADATSKANAAQSAAQAAAIAQASTYVTQLANGGWTAGSGTFITSTTISSPIIAANAGYISGIFKVGQNGITLDGPNTRIYIGSGTFGNANTGFYVDNGGNFSLGNQLTFTGGNLAIAGAASIGGTTATTIATGAAAGAAALQPGANISSLTNNSGFQDASSVNNAAKTAGSVGGWTINSTNLTSNNGRTILYNTGYIELKDTAGQNKITIDSSATLPSPTAGSDSGNIVVPAQSAQTVTIASGVVTGGTSPLVGPDANGNYGIGWSQQVWFTPTITGYYEFTTWFPKNDGMGATGTSGTAIMGLRAYIYDAAGNSLINEEGKEYIEGPVEGASVGATQSGYAAGTYGNQYNRAGTGAYFTNQLLTAGVAVRFLIQWIVFNIRNTDTLTIKAYWPATNVSYISNVPKVNINQEGFQVIQDTNRYLTMRPSGWYMYNDPAVYGGSPPTYLGDQGVTEVTGIMGGTLVVLNATDKNDWHSGKQKGYIRSAQFSFANRAAGGNFITSFFYGGYARSFNITRAYGWFTPNSNTGFSVYEDQWWPYAYNIESITRISFGKFQVTFAEAIMDTYGAYSGGGIYSVFIGRRDGDLPGDFTTAAISNIYHTGFIMDLGNETSANRFVSILVIG